MTELTMEEVKALFDEIGDPRQGKWNYNWMVGQCDSGQDMQAVMATREHLIRHAVVNAALHRHCRHD